MPPPQGRSASARARARVFRIDVGRVREGVECGERFEVFGDARDAGAFLADRVDLDLDGVRAPSSRAVRAAAGRRGAAARGAPDPDLRDRTVGHLAEPDLRERVETDACEREIVEFRLELEERPRFDRDELGVHALVVDLEDPDAMRDAGLAEVERHRGARVEREALARVGVDEEHPTRIGDRLHPAADTSLQVLRDVDVARDDGGVAEVEQFLDRQHGLAQLVGRDPRRQRRPADRAMQHQHGRLDRWVDEASRDVDEQLGGALVDAVSVDVAAHARDQPGRRHPRQPSDGDVPDGDRVRPRRHVDPVDVVEDRHAVR